MSRILTVYYHYSNNRTVPLIRLQGLWLEKLGFSIGCKIELTPSEGQIVINGKPIRHHNI